MLVNGEYVDGSWLLTVFIDELELEKQVRVQGDWSVAEVLARLTQDLPPPVIRQCKPNDISLRSGIIHTGWGDHCLWWPTRSRWLIHHRLSLNQYGIQADSWLRFVPIYGQLRVQLPDLQFRNFTEVNYAEPVFRVTMSICQHLNIRHPEELSLAQPISASDMKTSRIIGGVVDKRHHVNGPNVKGFQRSATISTAHSATKNVAIKLAEHAPESGENTQKQNGTLKRSSIMSDRLFGPPRVHDKRSTVRVSSVWSHSSKSPSPVLTNSTFYPGSISTLAFEFRSLEDPSLSCSPLIGVEEALAKGFVIHPVSFLHRLRLNAKWLESSKSLMEQGFDVCSQSDPNSTDCPTLLLRFKYGNFYDLNQKYDAVRINQLYEQAKWSVISGQLEATDDEACILAALQAHIEIRSEYDERDLTSSTSISKIGGHDISSDAKQHRSRDISPIGGYLRHEQDPKSAKMRPLSIVELDAQIDAMLDELSTIDGDEVLSLGGCHRSRTSRRKRTPRPLSFIEQAPIDYPDADLPELKGYIRVCKPRKFGMKMFRRLYVVVQGLKLLVFKTEEDFASNAQPSEVVYLPGCEVQPDLCMATDRYGVRIFVPVSRTNLPLSAAFNLRAIEADRAQDDELGLGGRLKRRASLLSLTSLSHLGLQSTGGPPGGLCGGAAAVLGLVNEVNFRFNDTDSYADWLAFLRLATAVPSLSLSPEDDHTHLDHLLPRSEWTAIVNQATYGAERKAIHNLIKLIKPMKSSEDQTVLPLTALHGRLEHRMVDFLPMRLGVGKLTSMRTIDFRGRDQPDTAGAKSTTLPADSKPPANPGSMSISSSQKSNFFRRIAIVYSQIQDLTSLQAKLKYISAWEQMPNHGIAYFPAHIEVSLPMSTLFTTDAGHTLNSGAVPWLHRPLGGGNVTVSSSRRVEAVGIGPTRILRCDIHTGDVLASWRLSSIQGWHVNWELGYLVLLLSTPQPKSKESQRSASPTPATKDPAGRVVIRPIGVSVRTLTEFLGGYTFLNLRAPDKNQGLNESVFYKLTTGFAFPSVH